MNILLLLPFVCSSVAVGNHPIPPVTDVTMNEETIQVLFGTRHGNRNPEKFVDDPHRQWGKEGTLELTSIGKRQAYGLGKEMRAFVGAFVDKNYRPSEAKFYSSSANRCQMTLQAATAGIFEAQDWAKWNAEDLAHWSPVPYTIDDPLLRMYAVDGCVTSDNAWKPISEDTLPDLAQLARNNEQLLQYMQKSDGRNATISNAADIADNIINIDFYNASYPDWLESPTLPGYDKASIREAFLAFAENHMNRCAADEACRNIMGGVWVNHLIDSMEKRVAGDSAVKLIGYASHTEVTLATMRILGYDKEELTTSAGFVIELRTPMGAGVVRLLQHDPNPIDQHVIYKAPLVPYLTGQLDNDGWMPLPVLKEFVKSAMISDWKSGCSINQEPVMRTTPTTCVYIDFFTETKCAEYGCANPLIIEFCKRTCKCRAP